MGFSLVSMINKEEIGPAEMFKTTTLAIIVFTVFVHRVVHIGRIGIHYQSVIPLRLNSPISHF